MTGKKDSPKKETFDLSDTKGMLNAVVECKTTDDLISLISTQIQKIINEASLEKDYKIVFLYDPDRSIRDYTANQIYRSISTDPKKDLLLLLVSPGGSIEPAYLISKICKEYGNNFIVTIPRRAKSAATLIALGADEIHMGIMSELGPIDPQIGGLPALGLSDAVQYLANLCKKFPESSDMFAKYLSNKLDLNILGYFQRVSESAEHYAQKLIGGKTLPAGSTAEDVAKKLVNFYKDHSFVIDKDEAKLLLGNSIKTDSPEYKLSDNIHKFVDEIHFMIKIFRKKDLAIIGNLSDGIIFIDSENSK